MCPLSNMYESLIFFSWTIVLIFILILEFKYWQKHRCLCDALALLAIALTSIIPGDRCPD